MAKLCQFFPRYSQNLKDSVRLLTTLGLMFPISLNCLETWKRQKKTMYQCLGRAKKSPNLRLHQNVCDLSAGEIKHVLVQNPRVQWSPVRELGWARPGCSIGGGPEGRHPFIDTHVITERSRCCISEKIPPP